jgi:arylsulfatase A-like enzyme
MYKKLHSQFAGVAIVLLLLSSILMADERPNILFIAVDDMNDWTGSLGGHPQAKTPNMDALAKRGVNFTNAHCVAPGCSPSRNAVLFGVEPFHSGLYPFYNIEKVPQDVLAPYTSLPRFFKESGYQTFGAGKIHHGSTDAPEEWNDYFHHDGTKLKYNADAGLQYGKSKKMAFCPTTNPLEDHPDYQVASYGVDVLSREHDEPFFLAVGIVKPHLAFVCPQKFFGMYPEVIEDPAIKPVDLVDIPWAGRAMANLEQDLRYRKDESWGKIRRAYLACISWADFNVGRVLGALDESQYSDNTIVVLWSDHGFHLGEKQSFRKFSLWEEATRVPFIIYDPRAQTAMQPGECTEGVSLINIYRTLADLAGLTPPEYVDGASLAPQLKDPTQSIAKPAITTWGRGNYSIRDEEWRYTRYFDGGEELYLHTRDENEWTNLAQDPQYADQKKRLAEFLPAKEAPLVRQGISLWKIVDADKPSLAGIKKLWSRVNSEVKPPSE